MPKTIYGDPHAAFVEALVSARKKVGLNQTDLGERLGRGQRFISSIERHQRRIDVVEWLAICRAIGVDPIDLYRQIAEQVPGPIDI